MKREMTYDSEDVVPRSELSSTQLTVLRCTTFFVAITKLTGIHTTVTHLSHKKTVYVFLEENLFFNRQKNRVIFYLNLYAIQDSNLNFFCFFTITVSSSS